MQVKKFIAYYRVSTQKQGLSGLGLEAQKSAVGVYLNDGSWELVTEFTEIETGKGANALDKRPQLRAALDACRKHGATLIIAKLDRLARNVYFVSGLLETGVEFIAADMPQANKVMIQMYSVMAEFERDQISARTKAALTAAKARGTILGKAGADNLQRNINERVDAANAFAGRLKTVIQGFKSTKMSQRAMMEEFNQLGIRAPKGGEWSLVQLQRVMTRITN
jgi:DNA invertase Pin-like site-specific DNA recombinase